MLPQVGLSCTLTLVKRNDALGGKGLGSLDVSLLGKLTEANHRPA